MLIYKKTLNIPAIGNFDVTLFIKLTSRNTFIPLSHEFSNRNVVEQLGSSHIRHWSQMLKDYQRNLIQVTLLFHRRVNPKSNNVRKMQFNNIVYAGTFTLAKLNS